MPTMPGLDPVFEFARGLSGVCEDGGAIAEGGTIRHLDGGVEVVHAHDIENRPENFLAGDGHVVFDVVDNCRAQIEAIRRIGHFHGTAVSDDARAFFFSGGNEAEDTIPMLRRDDRSHIRLSFYIGGAHLYRACRLDQTWEHVIGGFADGNSGRTSHATLAGAAERGH